MLRNLKLWWKLFIFAIVLIWYFIRLMVGYSLNGKHTDRGFRIRRLFCKAALNVFKIRVNTKGDFTVKGGLYISNHRSMLDPLIELSLLDIYILSKADVGDYPLIGRGAKVTGVYFVDRDNDQSRKAALQSIEKLLKEGKAILIYAEGTTHAAEFTSPFRKGTFEIAAQNNIPVHPVMIEYPDPSYYWTHEPLMGYFKRVITSASDHHVTVSIADPIMSTDAAHLLATTKSTIDDMIRTYRSSNGSKEKVKSNLKI